MPGTIAILASGNGTNAETLMKKVATGQLDVRIAGVICNRPGAGVITRAQRVGVPCLVLDHTQFASREAFDRRLAEELHTMQATWIVLAGYMRLLTAAFLHTFQGRVINLHPALLPSFPGVHGGRDALDYGVKISGCTVHFVEEKVDSGPVIIQAAVPVTAGEDEATLMARIHALEHRIYPQAVQWLAQGRLRVEGRQVYLTPGTARPAVPPAACLIWPPLEEGF